MKNIEWVKKEIENMPHTRFKREGMEDYILISKSDVLEYLDQLDEPEVLSPEWISENVEYAYFDMLDGSGRLSSATAIIKPENLQNLLVPKQEELDQAYKDGYDTGKMHAKTQVPVIPQFVTDWLEECKGWNDYEQEYDEDNAIGLFSAMDLDNAGMSDEIHDYLVDNTETFARAWLDGYEIEQEPKYYAKIKGHENIASNDKYWNYNTDMEELSVGDSEVHPNVISEYILKATKDEWANLGITDDNADFELVEELKECRKLIEKNMRY